MFILGLFRLAHLFSELLLMPCSPRMDSRSVLLLRSQGARSDQKVVADSEVLQSIDLGWPTFRLSTPLWMGGKADRRLLACMYASNGKDNMTVP